MKILVIGFGSIGKRHTENILSLGYHDVAVISNKEKLDEKFKAVKIYKTIANAFAENFFDAAFICTPTSKHIADLLLLLNYKVPNIYLEKPVSNDYSFIDEAIAQSNSYNAAITVGYDLHFHPCLQKAKELINAKAIGKIISVNAFAGQHLSQWRPYEDYTQGTSAKKETGGGVLLDLIHEFDYLYWLLGDVETVMCNTINTGTLKIETEEAADVLLKFASDIIGSVHLDYLQPQLMRYCIFTGEQGNININLTENKVSTNINGTKNIFDFSDHVRNNRFISIADSFLQNKNRHLQTTLSEGLKSLQIVLAAKRSTQTGCSVNIKDVVV